MVCATGGGRHRNSRCARCKQLLFRSPSTRTCPLQAFSSTSGILSADADCAPLAVGDICLHPVDTIKTVQQSVSDAAGSKSATSVVGAISKIFKSGGPLGFYAGAAPYVTLDALSGCIKFAAYEACNR
jgi:hypothetical protein